jgi:hypothetical protein
MCLNLEYRPDPAFSTPDWKLDRILYGSGSSLLRRAAQLQTPHQQAKYYQLPFVTGNGFFSPHSRTMIIKHGPAEAMPLRSPSSFLNSSSSPPPPHPNSRWLIDGIDSSCRSSLEPISFSLGHISPRTFFFRWVNCAQFFVCLLWQLASFLPIKTRNSA